MWPFGSRPGWEIPALAAPRRSQTHPKPTQIQREKQKFGILGDGVEGPFPPPEFQDLFPVYPRFKVPPHLQNSRTGLDWDGIRSIPTQTKIPGFPTLNPTIPKDKIPGWNSRNSQPVDGQLLLSLGQDPVLGSSGRGFDIPSWNSGPAVPGTVPGPPLPLGNSLGSVGQQSHAWEKGEIRDKPGEKQGKN